MHHFRYTGQNLACESVDLADVARLYGTPTYVYSTATMADGYARLAASLPGLDVRICYAVKANPNLAVLRHFSNLGAGFALSSGGDLRRALAAGGSASSCVLGGVGKTGSEIRLALESGVFALHVESEPELARVSHAAGQLGVRAPVALRLTTGLPEDKFGIPLKHAAAAYEAAAVYPNLELKGVQIHIGSQITEAAPFVEALDRIAPLVAELKARFGLGYLSMGGGMGIVYRDALASGAAAWWDALPEGRRPLTPEAYGAALLPRLQGLGLKVLLEPGRFLTGNAGVLLARVEYVKRGPGRTFVILDAGMNDLPPPALHDACHEVVPLHRDTTRRALTADIVGPVCESADCFGRDRQIQEVGEGEFVAILSAGAYGRSMASRYNGRPLPAEVLVRGSAFELVGERESLEQMTAGERIPAFLGSPTQARPAKPR